MKSEHDKGRDASSVGWRLSQPWGVAVIMLLMLGMVNTYVAVQSRVKSEQSLKISYQALPAFTQLRQQYGEVQQELAAVQLHQGLTANTNNNGFNVLTQLKQDIESTVIGPLQNMTGAAGKLCRRQRVWTPNSTVCSNAWTRSTAARQRPHHLQHLLVSALMQRSCSI
jgi:hypothetical protein